MNGEHAWLDKATRVGLMNSLSVEKSAGILETSLFLNGVAFSLPVDTAISMLSQLELYAKSCYNQTERHKMNIAACETIEEVESYDITTGYPDQLSFTL